MRNLFNKFLSWLFPYKGQPWKHLPQRDEADIRFERSLRNHIYGNRKKKPLYLLDQGNLRNKGVR